MLHIACAADSNYAPHCAAMLLSLLEHNRPSEIQVHFLHAPGLENGVISALRGMVEQGGAHIQFHEIADAQVSGLPRLGHISQIMWYRILLPEILPEQDRVLYLDADTLVLDDLHSLWSHDLDGCYVAAVTNVFDPQLARHPYKLGMASPDRYFNSGVLLFNLALMRADGCVQKILAFAKGRQLSWPDQDGLNMVLAEKRADLAPRWNCMNSLFLFPHARTIFGEAAIRDACRHPGIIHFEGYYLAKPWHYLNKHPFRRAYEGYRAATPWPVIKYEGRNWWSILLRPLPTSATIAILTLGYRVAARLKALRRRLAGA